MRTDGKGISKYMLHALLALALATQVMNAGAAGTTETSVFEFRPGVLADPNQSSLYLSSPDGGVDAVNITTGNISWHSPLISRPLALHGDTLLGMQEQEQADNRLVLTAISLTNPQKPLFSQALDLPEPVRAVIDDGPNFNFRIKAEIQGRITFLKWHYIRYPVNRLSQNQKTIKQSGVIKVDMVSGKVTAAGNDKQAATESPVYPVNIQKAINSGNIKSTVWFTGNGYAAIERKKTGTGLVTLLRRWDSSGKEQQETKLYDKGYSLRYPSADNRHLLVSGVSKTRPHDWNKYHWQIFSLDDGRRSMQLHHHTPAAWFFLSDKLLVHDVRPYTRSAGSAARATALSIAARNISDAGIVWQLPYRDTQYRGPMPSGDRKK